MSNRENMKNRLSRYILVVSLFIILAPWIKSAAGELNPSMTDKALVLALQGGGYNLYFRHAATDWSQNDDLRKTGDWLSCDGTRMRQLSNSGRETAFAIGQAIRALKIPVGKVLASPYCRTVETASLMQLGSVETTTQVMNIRAAEYFGGARAIAATAQGLLATLPKTKTNVLIVAHGNVLREATEVYPGEGEGIVFQPDGNGGYRYIARLTLADWSRLIDVVTD